MDNLALLEQTLPIRTCLVARWMVGCTTGFHAILQKCEMGCVFLVEDGMAHGEIHAQD